jgi:hypothetical protein
MKSLRIGILLAIALCVAASAYAHHSAAGIDQTKTVTQEGVVKEFKWANPHSWIELEVKNAKGDVEIWNLEMNPPSFLVRAGWKSTTIKPGDKIKFSAHPFKNGDPGGIFMSVTLPDGRTLTQTPPRGGPAAPAYEAK